ncbi:hypothetical protein AAMO2058_000765100 [Amorphochlora amoebiformis]
MEEGGDDGKGTDRKELHLYGSEITSIREIHSLSLMTQLIDLNLHCNQIRKIDNLHTLSNLKCLNLSSNEIKFIEGLSSLLSLEELDLSCNQISRVQGLGKLRELRRLSLAYNLIQDISGFSEVRPNKNKLQDIDLRDNQVKRVEDLNWLQGCTALTHLRFQSGSEFTNPLCSSPHYFTVIRSLLPSIELLDGHTITDYPRHTHLQPAPNPLPPPQFQPISNYTHPLSNLSYPQNDFAQATQPAASNENYNRSPSQGHDSRTRQQRGKELPPADSGLVGRIRVTSASSRRSAIDRVLSGFRERRHSRSMKRSPAIGTSISMPGGLALVDSEKHSTSSRNDEEKNQAIVQDLKKDVERLKSALASEKSTSDDLRQKLKSTESRSEGLKKQVETLSATLQEREQGMETRLTELASQLDSERTKAVTALSDSKKLQDQISSAQTQAEGIRVENELKEREGKERIAELEKRVAMLEATVVSEREAASAARGACERVEGQMMKCEGENRDLRSKVQSLNLSLDEKNGKCESLERNLQGLRQTEEAIRSQLLTSSKLSMEQSQTLIRRAVEAEAETRKWKEALDQSQSDLKRVERDLASSLLRAEELEARHTELTDQLKHLLNSEAGDRKRLGQELEREKKLRGDLEERVKALVRRVDDREKEVAGLKRMRESAQGKIGTVQKAYEAAIRDAEDLKAIMRHRIKNEKRTHEVIRKLKELVSEQRAKLESLTEQNVILSEAKVKITDIEDQARRLRKQVEELEDQNEELRADQESKEQKVPEDDITRLQEELTKFRDALVVKNKMLDDQNDTIATLKRAKERLEQDLDEAEKREEELGEQFDDLDVTKRKLEKTKTELRDRIDRYKADINTLQGKLLEAEEAIGEHKKKELENATEMKSLQDRLREKEAMVEFVDREVRKIKNAQQDENEKLKKDLEATKDALIASKNQLRSSNKLLKIAHDKCAKLQNQKKQLDIKVKKTEDEMRVLLVEVTQHRKRALNFARSLLAVAQPEPG